MEPVLTFMGSHAFHWYFFGLVVFAVVVLVADRLRRPKTEAERRARAQAVREAHLAKQDDEDPNPLNQ